MPASRRHFLVQLGATSTLWSPDSARPARRDGEGPPAAPPLLLAEACRDDVDPAGYLVSEKFDGVRAFWDGRRLLHRSGHPIAAPAWFLARLPGHALDGELWLGRRRFEALVGTVRRMQPNDTEWQQVRYLVFELPGASGTFAERAERLQRIARGAAWAPLQAVSHEPVAHRAELQRRLQAVIRAGGEGLMLHRADAPYLTGRNDALLKLKPHFDDEARVVGTRPGQGRFAGQEGALQVETADGVRFHLGSGLPDALRRDPPPLGTLVTYRYHDRTAAGVPRFASFLRLHTAL